MNWTCTILVVLAVAVGAGGAIAADRCCRKTPPCQPAAEKALLPIDAHELDRLISQCEGGVVNLPIAQISEARNCTVKTLREHYTDRQVLEFLHRKDADKKN